MFFASTSRNPQFYLVELETQIVWTQCIALLINNFNPAQSWSSLHAWLASGPVTFSTHIEKIWWHVSPTLTGLNPGILPNAIRHPEINGRYAAHGGFWLAIQAMKYSTLIRSFLLWHPNFSIHPCKASRSVSPGLALPKSFCVTNLTTSSVISTGIKTGVS